MTSSLFFNYLKRSNPPPKITWTEYAQNLEISVQQAFKFHNTYADDSNKCTSENQIPNIFYSPKGLDLEILKREYQKQGIPVPKLDLSPLAWNGRYSVIEHIDSDTIKYELDINVKIKKSGFQLSFTPEKYTYNNEIEESKMAMVALKCMQTIQPIVFSCEGDFQNLQLLNHSELIEKWVTSIHDLKEVFIDEYAHSYFQHFEENLRNASFLSRSLQSHFPFELFFKVPFSKKDQILSLHTLHPFNSIQYAIMEYQLLEKHQYKSIQINGLKNDSRSFEHISFNLDSPIEDGRPFSGKFSYELDYDPSAALIQALQFTHEIRIEKEEKSHSIIAYRIRNN